MLSNGLDPRNIIVATFTVKASSEMKDRIGKMIGGGMEDRLVLGTFHSISRRYLVDCLQSLMKKLANKT